MDVPRDHAHEAADEGHAKRAVDVRVRDNGDGSYTIAWQTETSGVYPVRVLVGGAHVHGSPTTITFTAGPPFAPKCTVDGDGLSGAKAGLKASVFVRCKDRYANRAACRRSDGKVGLGLLLLPAGSGSLPAEGVESRARFEGAWVGDDANVSDYRIDYTANEAGDFELHLWLDPDGSGTRQWLPGSPFTLLVSGVSASANGSILLGAEQYADYLRPVGYVSQSNLGAETPPSLRPREGSRMLSKRASIHPSRDTIPELMPELPAGSRVLLKPQLRDDYGNASSANEESLLVLIDAPDGVGHDVTATALRSLPQLGSCTRPPRMRPRARPSRMRPRGRAPRARGRPPQTASPLPHPTHPQAARAHAALLAPASVPCMSRVCVLSPSHSLHSPSLPPAPPKPLRPTRSTRTDEISYDPQLKGRHTMRVELNGQQISQSPFRFSVLAGSPMAQKSRIRQVTEPGIVGQTCVLMLETTDKFGNAVEVGGASIAARALGTGVSPCVVEDNQNGTYSLSFTSNVVGDARVIVRLDNVEMPPFLVNFVKGDASAAVPTDGPPAAAAAAPVDTPDGGRAAPKEEPTESEHAAAALS